ncbi:hypothetical protein [Longimicrobium sp.]|uniref:hypothetical protein n=1 Tax=Longimicrobium sp. TaxID=2029185 RepID=UPI002E345F96|nr:hypothetical protein [Longimicrobium sp.]HEX6036598.1 hypothetical protein [Longimicrobium sp.]
MEDARLDESSTLAPRVDWEPPGARAASDPPTPGPARLAADRPGWAVRHGVRAHGRQRDGRG